MPRPKKSQPKRHERHWYQGTVREVRPHVWRAWRARVHKPDGTSTRPSKTFYGAGAKDAALAWARDEPASAVLYFGQWLELWLGLRAPRLQPQTLYNYRRHIEACGDLLLMPLAAVTVDHLQARANELLQVRVRADVVNWRSCVSSALKAAVVRGYRADNPASGVGLPKPEDHPVKAWSAEEVGRLVEHAIGASHEAWLWLSLGTGIRMGEARALRRSDIDVLDRVVTIGRSMDEHTDEIGPTKNGKTRLVNLPDEVVPFVVAHLARLPASEHLVFRAAVRKGAVSPRAIQQWLKRLCARAGVAVLPCHSTRHTFATLALDKGAPLKEVSEQLGHANIAITAAIYSHQVDRRSRRAASAIGAVLSGGKDRPAQITRVE